MPTTSFEKDDGSIDRARQLRRETSPAERKLWSALRAGKLDGIKFRRQQRLGPFFADFACQSKRLVIEVDGPTHDGDVAQDYDQRRTAYLEREGYRVIRFTNADVMKNLDGVVSAIRAALADADSPSPVRASHGHPLPRGERG